MAVLSGLGSNAIQLLSTSGTVSNETVGEAVAENDALFKVTDSGTGTVGTVKKLVNTSEEAATFYGFALAASANSKVVPVLRSGSFEMDGATFTAGQVYVASSTAGALELASDLISGDELSVVGGADTTTTFTIHSKYIGSIP